MFTFNPPDVLFPLGDIAIKTQQKIIQLSNTRRDGSHFQQLETI
jgi:hypothetical protein